MSLVRLVRFRIAPVVTALAVTLLIAGSAVAQDGAGTSRDDTIPQAFFHVEVSGTAADGTPISRGGKGFAVAPDVVVTALSLVGTQGDWKPKGDRQGLAGITHPLQRDIALSRQDGAVTADNFLLPTPFTDNDAAAIAVPDLGANSYFQLSFCPISTEESYTAIVSSSDNPRAPSSIKDIDRIDLIPKGYKPAEYGGLYVFDVDRDANFSPEPDGHQGSPIVDGKGDVVALISAVIATGADHEVLATPVQPLIPGVALSLLGKGPADAPPEHRPSCSLAETVDQLQDDVSKLAIWDLKVERDAEGRPDTVEVSYDGFTSDTRITGVNLYFGFYGVDVAFDRPQPVGRISFDDNGGKVQMDPSSEKKRTFTTHEIGRLGKKLVEPAVKDRAGAKGRIDYVDVFIVPIFGDVESNNPTERSFAWRSKPTQGGGP